MGQGGAELERRRKRGAPAGNRSRGNERHHPIRPPCACGSAEARCDGGGDGGRRGSTEFGHTARARTAASAWRDGFHGAPAAPVQLHRFARRIACGAEQNGHRRSVLSPGGRHALSATAVRRHRSAQVEGEGAHFQTAYRLRQRSQPTGSASDDDRNGAAERHVGACPAICLCSRVRLHANGMAAAGGGCFWRTSASWKPAVK